MRAWRSARTSHTVQLVEEERPAPARGEILIEVIACGVCRTDLHVIDGDLDEHRPGVIPGHQVVGRIAGLGDGVPGLEVGDGAPGLEVGDLVGVAWLRSTCGVCQWCRSGSENLCPVARFTGWDFDGGFAEYMTAPAAYVYPLPADVDPVETAPLLCAGIIGYRALQRANLPPGGRLGLYGYGSSAHLVAQMASAAGAQIYVVTRGDDNQALARTQKSTFVGDESAVPPEPLDAAIVFAPAGPIVPQALSATAPGGTVVLAGIHLSDIPALDYEASLFHERDLRSVTANTRSDGDAFLRLARQLPLRPHVTTYSFSDVSVALDDLRAGRASGSLVIATPRP
ncbi:alcohol dehydrogenase (plasmid) [Frondihabitans sp. PAMC 28766]|uniref:zinc-binding alcohol dehydrogenase family protein n=1 Tax=Frondihabitans sp. PAMC 28766 TaxID=1795630 RepID=UPI00078C6826|nr:zinc-binding alcohol dehydrogenase family protein [Frondihabitans sp. PAMC 28766]AMM22758.1 alcohol dehydrogenase [Frondihabitans sp. PAMC 28766]